MDFLERLRYNDHLWYLHDKTLDFICKTPVLKQLERCFRYWYVLVINNPYGFKASAFWDVINNK